LIQTGSNSTSVVAAEMKAAGCNGANQMKGCSLKKVPERSPLQCNPECYEEGEEEVGSN